MQKEIYDCKRELEETLLTRNGDWWDICYKIFDLISKDSNPNVLLQYFYENYEDFETSEEVEVERVYSEQEKQALVKEYSQIVDGVLDKLLSKNYDVVDFYKILWQHISDDTIFETKKAKAFVIYYLCSDLRIPYFKLNQGLKMANEEFREKINKMKMLMKESRFIVASSFEQRTERASLLLELLDKVEDSGQRAVLMAYIISVAKKED